MVDEKKIKYSDSPFAPDWAKDPALRDRTITSFGKPLPLTNDLPSPFDEQSDVNDKTDPNYNQTSSDAGVHPTVEQIEDILWQDTDEDIQVYCIMDGYWADGLYGRLLNSPDLSWAHMFQGDVATRNVQQAPFIIALKRGHKLTKWLIEEGWGKGWGIYFTASTKKADLLYGTPLVHDKRFLPSNEEQLKLGNLVNGQEDPLWKMRRHFRQFSDVYLEGENKIVDFRYYDPWVLSIYISTCDLTARKRFFNSITNFYTDGYADNKKNNNYSVIYIENLSQILTYNIKEFICSNIINFSKNKDSEQSDKFTLFVEITKPISTAFQEAQKNIVFKSIIHDIKIEPIIKQYRHLVTINYLEEIYDLCSKYIPPTRNNIYSVVLFTLVFGKNSTEKTLKKWLNEKTPSQTIAPLMVNYARTIAITDRL